MILFACSGFDGPPEALVRNIEIAHHHATVVTGLFVAILALFAINPRRCVLPAIMLGLFALHPAWTISAIDGDCGFFKRDASWAVTGFGMVTICCQVVSSMWNWFFPSPLIKVGLAGATPARATS